MIIFSLGGYIDKDLFILYSLWVVLFPIFIFTESISVCFDHSTSFLPQWLGDLLLWPSEAKQSWSNSSSRPTYVGIDLSRFKASFISKISLDTAPLNSWVGFIWEGRWVFLAAKTFLPYITSLINPMLSAKQNKIKEMISS